MNDDNLYPNDGAPFMPAEPTEQEKDLQAEKGKLLEALPLVQDIIARFNEQIDFLGRIDSIPDKGSLTPAKMQQIILANDLSKRFLTNQKEWLEGLIEDHFNKR